MRPVLRSTTRVTALVLVSCAVVACSLTLDYDKLDAKPGAADALVQCAGATCGQGDVCCLTGDGKSRCSAPSACGGTALPCLAASDCVAGTVCCGWGRTGASGAEALVVACRTRTECGTREGARLLCSSSVPVPCPEADDRCIPTETLPGASKCVNASDAL